METKEGNAWVLSFLVHLHLVQESSRTLTVNMIILCSNLMVAQEYRLVVVMSLLIPEESRNELGSAIIPCTLQTSLLTLLI